MPEPGYRGVSLPEGLVNQVEKVLADLRKRGVDLGYRTTSEFVKDAVRRRVEELRQNYSLGNAIS